MYNLTLNEFNDYFSMLSNDIKQVYDLDVENFCNFEELNQPITLQEVEYAIHKLCKNKAMGSDCLMNEIFIEDILSLHMTDLFNAIFSSGFFPDQ